jgi:replicative DNA helicase
MIAPTKQPRNGSALDPTLCSCERSVLSYLMRDRRACEELCHLSTEDFCLPTHRVTFRAITDVFAEGQDPNEFVVTNRLRATKNLDSVGGAAEVTSIASETTSVNRKIFARLHARSFLQAKRGKDRRVAEKRRNKSSRSARTSLEAERASARMAGHNRQCNGHFRRAGIIEACAATTVAW